MIICVSLLQFASHYKISKSRSRVIKCWQYRVALNCDRRLSSIAVETLVTFHNDSTALNLYLVVARLFEILFHKSRPCILSLWCLLLSSFVAEGQRRITGYRRYIKWYKRLALLPGQSITSHIALSLAANQGPISRSALSLSFKSCENFICGKYDPYDPVSSEICTCHDSSAVVTCAKL